MPPADTTVTSPIMYRYYFNTVTHGYTTPYWGWKRWEKEVDWMAMHGINMPLIVGAQEAILYRVFEKPGPTKDEILDYFSGLPHFPTVSYSIPEVLDTVSVGLVLHNKKGEINSSQKEGWASYWEPIDDYYLGTAIIVDPKKILGIVESDSDTEQDSDRNIRIDLKPDKNNFSYWSGFGWKKEKILIQPVNERII